MTKLITTIVIMLFLASITAPAMRASGIERSALTTAEDPMNVWQKYLKTGVNKDYDTYIPTPQDFGEYVCNVPDSEELIPSHVGNEWSITGLKTWVYAKDFESISVGIIGDDGVGLYCDGRFVCGRGNAEDPMSFGTLELSPNWHKIEALVYNGPDHVAFMFDKKISDYVDAMAVVEDCLPWMITPDRSFNFTVMGTAFEKLAATNITRTATDGPHSATVNSLEGIKTIGTYTPTPTPQSGGTMGPTAYSLTDELPADPTGVTSSDVTLSIDSTGRVFAWTWYAQWANPCDPKGSEEDRDYKRAFLPGEDVYVWGAGFPANKEVAIYIIPDRQICDPANAKANVNAKTDNYGWIPKTNPVLVWSNASSLGSYDIWVDVNQNGRYDCGDVFFSSVVSIFAFFVVPGPTAIISTLFMFSALATFRLIRKRKLHP